MAGFNPDLYLKGKKPPFDPNAYLSLKTGKVPPKPGMEDITPGESFLANLAPKGIVSAAYGASEAAPGAFSRPFAETLAKYRKERDYAKTFLEESKSQNPRSALAGKIVGTTPYAIAAGPEMAAQGLLGGALAAAESDADLTRLDDPEERARFGTDVGTGLITGTAMGGMASYAPVTTATVGTGALAGQLATGDDKGALYGAGAGLLLRGGMAAANPVTRDAVKNLIFKPYEVSPNATKIIAAAERQGIAPESIPGYMLTENEEAKRSADALLKSGRFGGGLMRKEIEPVRTVLKEGTDELLADATPKSAYEVGTAVQKGVRSKAESMLEPISAEYEALDTKYGAKDASSRSVKNVGKKLLELKSEPGLGPEARSILGEVERDLGNVKTIGDLKKIRTNLNNQLKRDGQGNVISDKNAIRVVSELNDAFTRARENSIKLSGKKVTYDLSKLPSTSKEVPDIGGISPLQIKSEIGAGRSMKLGPVTVKPGPAKNYAIVEYAGGSKTLKLNEVPAYLSEIDAGKPGGAVGQAAEGFATGPYRKEPAGPSSGFPDFDEQKLSKGMADMHPEIRESIHRFVGGEETLDGLGSIIFSDGTDDLATKAINEASDFMEFKHGPDIQIPDAPEEVQTEFFQRVAKNYLKNFTSGGAPTEELAKLSSGSITLPKKTVTTTFWDGVLESKKFPTVGRVSDDRGGEVKKIGDLLFRKLKDGKVVVATQDGEPLASLTHDQLPALIKELDANDAGIAADLAKKGFKIPKRIEYDRSAILNQRAVDAKYRGTIQDIEKALPYGSKGGKGGLLPVEKLERVQPEKVRESLGLFTDRDTREAFTKTFPEEAELVRRAELSKIKGSTTPPQGDEQRNPRIVLNELFGSPRGTPRYDEEALVALLKDKKLTADDLRVIAAALPQNYNPSGTSNQATFLDALMRPKESIGSYLAKKKLDLKTPSARGLLKGKKDAGRVGKAEEAIKSLFDKTGKGLLRKDERR